MTDESVASAPAPRTSRPTMHAGELAWLLFAAACLAALGDVTVPWAARVIVERYTFFNPHTAWLTPVPWLLLVTPVVLLVRAAAGRWLPDRARLMTVSSIAFFMVLEPMLILSERIEWVALVVLALGLGVQLGRMYGLLASPAIVMRRVAIAGGLAVAAVGAGWSVHLNRHEAGTLAALPTAREGAPNVLLIVLDTIRAMELGMHGGPHGVSPWLDAFAARGVRFDRAYAASSWTLPSHATLFTGRYPFETSADWHTPLDATFPTLAERFAARGYATGAFSANLRYVSRVFGLARGFARFDDFAINASEAVRGCNLCSHATFLGVNAAAGTFFDPGRKHAERISGEALAWLGRQSGSRPWFAFLNYYDAHAPYAPPPPYDTLFASGPIRHREVGPAVGEEEPVMRETREAYQGAIASLDKRLGAFVDSLDRLGLLENTIVVITSDHGEHFGEHRLSGHGNSLYGPVTHVPLVIVARGRIAPGVVSEPVTQRDVPVTLLSEADGGTSARDLPGHSLRWAWSSDTVSAQRSPILQQVSFFAGLDPHVPTAKGDLQAIVAGQWHLMRRADGFEELFDVQVDPETRNDLFAAASMAVPRSQAQAALTAGAGAMPRPLPPPSRVP